MCARKKTTVNVEDIYEEKIVDCTLEKAIHSYMMP